MKRTAYLWISILLPFLMLVACSSNEREEGKAAQQTLESAAQAFVKGFNNRDLTQFDTYFAPPDKADAAVVTQDVALRKTNGKWSIVGADKPEINKG